MARQFLTAPRAAAAGCPSGAPSSTASQQLVETLPGNRVVAAAHATSSSSTTAAPGCGDPTGGAGPRLPPAAGHASAASGGSATRPTGCSSRARTSTRQYQQYSLYFFDQSAQVLVPEPVYVPRGRQAPTLLVAGAAARARRLSCAGVERTFLPRGTAARRLSVPVTRDGTAEVPLSDEVLDLDDDAAQPAVRAAGLDARPGRRASSGCGSPSTAPRSTSPAARVDVAVDDWSEFDPAVAWASTTLFGLRDGRVVTAHRRPRGADQRSVRRRCPLGLRSIGVDLPAQHVAGVTADGTPRRGVRPGRGRPVTARHDAPTSAPSTPAAPTCCGRPTTSTASCGSWTAPPPAPGSSVVRRGRPRATSRRPG